MSRAAEQKANVEGFVKIAELVGATSQGCLTLQDRRILNLLVENAWPDIAEERPYSIAMAHLRGPRHKGAERVADSVRRLMATLIEIPGVEHGQAVVSTMQVLGPTTRVVDESSPHAYLRYVFPPELRAVMLDSTRWGRLRPHLLYAFTSKFALALYEAVALRANMRTTNQTFPVLGMRALFDVAPHQFRAFSAFRQRVIAPAVAEVCAITDFDVEIEPLRRGGPERGLITGYVLSWTRKSPEAWAAVQEGVRQARFRARPQRVRPAVEAEAVAAAACGGVPQFSFDLRVPNGKAARRGGGGDTPGITVVTLG